MKNKKQLFIMAGTIIVCITIICVCHYKFVSYSQRREDAEYLVRVLEKNYPFFETKSQQESGYNFLENKDKLISKIANSKDDLEFYVNITKVVGLLANRHNSVIESGMISNIPIANLELLKVESNQVLSKMKNWDKVKLNTILLPDIIYKYVEGNYVIIGSSNPNIKPGDFIMEVEDIPIHNYVKDNVDFNQLIYDSIRGILYNDNNNLFMQLNSVAKNKKINVTLEDENGTLKNSEVNLTSFDENVFFKEFLNSKLMEENITSKIIEKDEIAYLKISSMIFSEEDKEEVNRFFKSINNYKNLIIDVRDNGGGWSIVSSELIQNINSNPNIKVTNYLCYKKSELTEKYLNDHSNSMFGDYSKISSDVYGIESDDFTIIKNLTVLPYSDAAFKGDVYILTDGGTFSAGDEFTNNAKRSKLGKVIGIPTSGGGIGTSPILFTLPNSNLCIRIAICLGMDSQGNVNEEVGTTPDVYVEQSVNDYRKAINKNIKNINCSEYDTVFNKCINIINEDSK